MRIRKTTCAGRLPRPGSTRWRSTGCSCAWTARSVSRAHLVVARKADAPIALPKPIAAQTEETVNIALGEEATRH
jgi:hypothetical protein